MKSSSKKSRQPKGFHLPTKIFPVLIAALFGVIAIAFTLRSFAATPPIICTTCIGVIGDSLTYQAGRGIANTTTALMNDGWTASNIKVNAIVGRPIAKDFGVNPVNPGAVSVINSWKASGFDPQVYAIFLGANNLGSTATAWTTEMNKDLTAIGPGHTIIWLDQGIKNGSDSRVLNFNANLAKIAAGRTDLFVAKVNNTGWNTWIHAQPNQSTLWLSTDSTGRHMTFAGYALREQFVGQALKPYAPIATPVTNP